VKAKIIAAICIESPPGYSWWTLRLLMETLAKDQRRGDVPDFPLERKKRIVGLFNELTPRFQEYALTVIDQLPRLQKEQR
jgi:hypothetical protein